jgi:hypothetical protein
MINEWLEEQERKIVYTNRNLALAIINDINVIIKERNRSQGV